jgi:hypothetical protein
MDENERWSYLTKLDEELLIGGVILSEWCAFIVREADIAFAKGANLAAILTAVSGIETHLRAEYSSHPKERLADLIDRAVVETDVRADLHRLRKYRNKWVHVSDPWEDNEVLDHPERFERELEEMAVFSVGVLRRVLYHAQWL